LLSLTDFMKSNPFENKELEARGVEPLS